MSGAGPLVGPPASRRFWSPWDADLGDGDELPAEGLLEEGVLDEGLLDEELLGEGLLDDGLLEEELLCVLVVLAL